MRGIKMSARAIKMAAQGITTYWAENGKPNMVFLGRDCWPIYALLKEQGVDCQYFLFSRLQIGDAGTKKQWLKEVPIGSLVVDTGYKGTIIDAIHRFDPTIRGLLVCSSGKYPQIELNVNHRYVVTDIERLPKIVGRCVSIDERGIARCPQDTRDREESIGGLKPNEVIEYNKTLCRAIGISEKWASFTGITPASRAGNNWRVRCAEKNERLFTMPLGYDPEYLKPLKGGGLIVHTSDLSEGYSVPFNIDGWASLIPHPSGFKVKYVLVKGYGFEPAVPIPKHKK